MCYLFYKPWEVLFPIVCVDLNAPRGKSRYVGEVQRPRQPCLKSFTEGGGGADPVCKNLLTLKSIFRRRIEKFPAIARCFITDVTYSSFPFFSFLLFFLFGSMMCFMRKRSGDVAWKILTNVLDTSFPVN